MFRSLRSSCALATAAAAFIITPALAGEGDPPTPEQLVEQCLGEIGGSTGSTDDAIEEATLATIETIRELDANGARPAALRHAARHGRHAIKVRARAGNAQVSVIKSRCLHALTAIGSGPVPKFTVKGAALTSYQITTRNKAMGVRAINLALRRALADESDEDATDAESLVDQPLSGA